MSDGSHEETEPEGPDWSTGNVDAGGVARDLACRWEGFWETFMVTNLVQCKTCTRAFPRLATESSNQGVDCAGFIQGGKFVGCYGSCFDMEMLAISGIENDLDPICDYCVFQWVREGRVTYLRETGAFSLDEGKRCKYRETVHCVARGMADWKW